MPRCSDLKRPRFPIMQVCRVPFKIISFVINLYNLMCCRGDQNAADDSKTFRRRIQGCRRRVQNISPTRPRISPTCPKYFDDASKDFADVSKIFRRHVQGFRRCVQWFHRQHGNDADATSYLMFYVNITEQIILILAEFLKDRWHGAMCLILCVMYKLTSLLPLLYITVDGYWL